ncbi:MAG TPA: hypothetical protein VFP76_02775 [Gemmatimonadota bacterium]|nr:hypothetical protein [Gemmatimonadota bacterium]
MRRALGLALLALVATAPLRGQDTPASAFEIRVVADPRPPGSAALTVGDPFWVTVRTSGPAGHYLLPQSILDGFGARPEVAVLASERRDGQLRLEMAMFRPGDLVLPEIEAQVTNGLGDTLAVPVVSDTIRVASVLTPGDTLLADIKPIWTTPGLPWWLGLVAVALAAVLAILWWRRRPRRRRERPAAGPVLDPYTDARRRIEALGAEPGNPAGRVAAAAGIGDALRDYLADGWGVAARERTTLELLSSLPEVLRAERTGLMGVLSGVDLAKFARLAPDPGEVPGLAERALATLERLEDLRREPAPEDEVEAELDRKAAS